MVNFRYHIVSLVAVFLALAIGVVMGSTVIDRVTVETLQNQQRRLDDNLTKARAENQKISSDLDDLRVANSQIIQETSERLVPGTLRDVPVLLIGIRGNDPEGRKELIDALGQANARVQATLWLTEKSKLLKLAEQKEMAELLGVDEKSPSRLRQAGLESLGSTLRSLAIGEAADGTILAKLSDGGFIEIDSQGGDVPIGILPGTRVLLTVTPEGVPTGEAKDPIAEANKNLGETVITLTKALVGGSQAPIGLVLAEAAVSDQPERALLLEVLRSDKSLERRFSSVDNLDQPAGRVAILLAVGDLGADGFGHYGSGPGASRLIPAPPLVSSPKP